MIAQPNLRPARPFFSSGPTAKRPGWTPEALNAAAVSRLHRSPASNAKAHEVIARSRRVLGLPDDFGLAIVPGSDSGAFESAMWNLLGPRGVDCVWSDAFGARWHHIARDRLKLSDVRQIAAPYGRLPDLTRVDWSRDVTFVWNATAGGVCMPDGDWIAADRQGLALCDATSAAFAMELPWDKLDVVTWSWQKVMGGEGAHGMLAFSPRAFDRLRSHRPAWPVPWLYQLSVDGAPLDHVWRGEAINTVSMLCVEDALDALAWIESIGGVPEVVRRSRDNYKRIRDWVARTDWVEFLAADEAYRSWTSVCLNPVASWYATLPDNTRAAIIDMLAGTLERHGVAYDIKTYRDAPPGLRLWAGATVDGHDLEALFPWLDWGWEQARLGCSAGVVSV